MIFVVDNYDSFTYNLVQYLGQCGAEVQVARNDEVSLDEILAAKPDGILLSPGPRTPRESGVCLDLLARALQPESAFRAIPIFGVCLGHQAMGHAGGGIVRQAASARHGKTSMISHDGKGVFAELPSPFLAVRYHSLVIDPLLLPEVFDVTARSEDDGEIMGIRHRTLPIEGVQFHPESILTEHGLKVIENFVQMTKSPLVQR